MNFWKVSTIVLAAALMGVVGFSTLNTATASDQTTTEPQPQMKKAMRALQNAQRHLEQATPDKGGHRVKALQLTTAALAEVREGIKFDNRH